MIGGSTEKKWEVTLGPEAFASAIDGRELGFTHPYSAAGNTLSQWLSALHTGRVGGLSTVSFSV